MTVHDTLEHSLSLISAIHPAATLLHIGAGGPGMRFTEIVEANSYVLVEGDERRAERLALDYEGRQDVDVIQAVVANKEDEADFFKLSIADESGTLNAPALKAVWPNIETVDVLPVHAMSLSSLMNRKNISGGPHVSPNWIVISCLQVSDLLIGARDVLESTDVIVARVVLTKPDHDTALHSSAHETLHSALVDVGFVKVLVHPEGNAKFARVVYVRDWKTQAHSQQKNAKRLLKEAEEQSAVMIEKVRAKVATLNEEKVEIANDLLLAKARAEDLAEEMKDCALKIEAQNRQLGEAHGERERAEKKQRIAENNLEAMREKYRLVAQKQLEAEEKLVDLGNQLERFLESVGKAKAARHKSSDSTKKPPRTAGSTKK